MRTTPLAKSSEIERKWYIIDATDVSLGRLSAAVATILRGKNKLNTHLMLIPVIMLYYQRIKD